MLDTNKKSVCIILDHELKHYRVEFFNSLSNEFYNIHVLHPGKEIFQDAMFSSETIKVKSFKFFDIRLYPKLSQYDAVIHMQNMRVINLWLLSLNPFKNYSLYHWGIGWSSSKGLDKNSYILFLVRCFLILVSNGTIFYSEAIRNRYPEFIKKKIHVAPNTIGNRKQEDCSGFEKDCFIFIGTLNARKGLSDLIDAYERYTLSGDGNNLKLVIIGDGPYKSKINKLILDKRLSNNVEMIGSLSSENDKLTYFKRAVACISPKQAGLSVLESFSFGVPFVCYDTAISGGEHFNIVHGNNGFLVKDAEELYSALLELSGNQILSQNLGRNAFEFYTSERTIGHMVGGFMKALD